MTRDPFLTDWHSTFGDALPDGSELRQLFPARWTRFHALPNAKRYADTPQDWAEILHRGNSLAADLFAAGEVIWLATCHWPAHDQANSPPGIAQWGMVLHWQRDWPLPKDYFEAAQVPVYAATLPWQAGRFDPVLRDIADDAGNAVFFAPASGRVFAPYDGGFDLIDADAATLRSLEHRHAAWMSTREDRL